MGRAAASRPEIPEPIRSGRVIAIARGLKTARLLPAVAALVASGIRAVEVTLNSPGALESLTEVSRRWAGSDVAVGAGTVLDLAGAEAAVAAGAAYLVMPHTDTEIVAWAADHGIPCLPGAMTATEVLAAWRAGAAAVKLFHAGTLGPSYLKGLREPLGDIPLVPTGGVSADNAADFLRAGAVAIGVGGWLLAGGDAVAIRERAGQLATAIRHVR